VNALGLGLLLVGALLVLVEMAAPGLGLAGVSAAVVSVLGVALLVGDGPGPDVSAALAAPVVVAAVVGVALVARRVARAQDEPSVTSGPGAVLARETTVRAAAGQPCQGFVAGAWWTLRSTGAPLADGDQVIVVGIDGLVLEVEHLPPPDGRPADSRPHPEEKDQ
jgi:membrane-bound serine protease (ClpP class)